MAWRFEVRYEGKSAMKGSSLWSSVRNEVSNKLNECVMMVIVVNSIWRKKNFPNQWIHSNYYQQSSSPSSRSAIKDKRNNLKKLKSSESLTPWWWLLSTTFTHSNWDSEMIDHDTLMPNFDTNHDPPPKKNRKTSRKSIFLKLNVIISVNLR